MGADGSCERCHFDVKYVGQLEGGHPPEQKNLNQLVVATERNSDGWDGPIVL
ncbi:hypothetical protein M413DRAFT_446978 [Hebeloma cylindrosporum]|uniref:Uncharacterized protein n=1 Tax=Hebeloma cylindrosporum TaxID=76867 RepID=A0A0C3BRZ6_HEBCY|nr:hypothetical protein M413DRAFT_446978 [Hebeloma cylindrosporum h7]